VEHGTNSESSQMRSSYRNTICSVHLYKHKVKVATANCVSWFLLSVIYVSGEEKWVDSSAGKTEEDIKWQT